MKNEQFSLIIAYLCIAISYFSSLWLMWTIIALYWTAMTAYHAFRIKTYKAYLVAEKESGISHHFTTFESRNPEAITLYRIYLLENQVKLENPEYKKVACVSIVRLDN